MKTRTVLVRSLTALGIGLIAITAAAAEELVTIESLLNEMVARDAVARYPQSDFRLKQQSSHDRLSKTPDDPQGWFANKDHTKNFVRVEENNGGKEWVPMEHEGAGAIVRTWMPFRSRSNPKTSSRIRIYLDGSSDPVLEGNMLGLLNGTGLIPFPLAHKSLRSAVSFFPIPYAESCKVTVTEQPFFFQFTYRDYPEGTQVKTFTMEDFEAAKSLTEKGAVVLPALAKAADNARSETNRFDGAIECESMRVVAQSEGITARPQSLRPFPGNWSAASHLFVRQAAVGDFVELRFPAKDQTRAKLILHATRSYDYGILRFKVNGQPAGAETDLYAPKPTTSGRIELGLFEPVSGAFSVRAEVVGKNAKSSGTYFGLDCIVIDSSSD